MDPHLAHFPRQPGLLGPLPRGSPVILPIKCLPLRILALAGAVAVLAPLVAVIQPQRASADEVVPAAVEFADRKSTRLNSSHVAISYAVFCLKKKKKKTRN